MSDKAPLQLKAHYAFHIFGNYGDGGDDRDNGNEERVMIVVIKMSVF